MWKKSLNIFLLILFNSIQDGSGQQLEDVPLVNTNLGQIRGLRADDGDYSMFMGIPYATVNENNPFGPAVPHPGFEEVFEAYDDSAICPQIEEFNNTIVGTLDCLHVNVYVPNTASSINPLPVLVWIYGGGFSIGFAGRYLYGPKYLVSQDIILVTLNYRLGPYGFMCLNTPDVPGNEGLKDQQLALKWIKNNINAFGGDENKITIAGNSAGSTSVDFQFKYNQEKLFDQVIMQSGAALAPWSISEPDTSAPFRIAEALGFSTTDMNQALTFLATVDPEYIIAATDESGVSFSPCLEQEFENTNRFIFDYPINIEKPTLEDISVLVGYNREESHAGFAVMSPDAISSVNWFEVLRALFNLEDEEFIQLLNTVTHFYIGDERISENVVEAIGNFNSDLYFIYPTVRTVEKYAKIGLTNLYHYIFSYSGGRNFVKDRLNITVPGAMHADEIGYLFDISYMNEATPEDQLIIDRMTTLWVNFVKYGNPTPTTTELLPIQWPAATADVQYYFEIDSEVKVGRRNFKDRMAFWRLLYIKYAKGELGYN